MEDEDNIIVKWAQEDVETSHNLLNNNNGNTRSVVKESDVDLQTFATLTKRYQQNTPET